MTERGATGPATSAARRRRSSDPRRREELAEIVRRRGGARPAGQGLGLGPLVHRHRAHRRGHGPLRPPRPGALGRSATRAWSRSRRGSCSASSTAASTSSGSRSRTSATSTARRSPARSRPATHGTGARFRSVSAQVEAVELVLADGSSVEISAGSTPTDLARGPDRPRRARGGLRGHDPRRARLHPRPRRQPRSRSTRRSPARRAQRGQRPLRVLRLPPHRDRALPREPAHRRAAAPALARRASTPRR